MVTWTFGTYRLSPRALTLTDGDVPVRLGSRAFRLLIALVEQAGTVLTVDELKAHAWPNMFVEEVTLRTHIHALRKVLGDGRGGADRYIVNESGRGYAFVAPVITSPAPREERPSQPRLALLPGRTTKMVGRDALVQSLPPLLATRRFMTLTGAGGVGKTTIALAVAEASRGNTCDDAQFIDLTTVTDPQFVLEAVARPFALSLPATDALATLVTFLAERRLLLVLDNCEHVIDAAAEVAEALHRGAPAMQILCTSREPLRAQGEWVHHVDGLEVPPLESVSPREALEYGAIQLFVERAVASQAEFSLAEHNVGAICRICHRLDGLPLALELAAANLDSLSPAELLGRLEDRFALLTRGRRTAPPRQHTMRATLDWSHALLSWREKILFRRLSVFRSAFDLTDAVACAKGADLTATEVVEGIGGLTAKSLLTADLSGETTLFRLSESARDYALERLTLAKETGVIRLAHARLMRDRLTEVAVQWRSLTPMSCRRIYGRLIDDVRAAIDWSMEDREAQSLGVILTNLAGPLAYILSLIPEFYHRYEKAYSLLANVEHDLITEVQMTCGLATFSIHAGQPPDRPIALLDRARAAAERLQSDLHLIEVMAHLWIVGFGVADYASMDEAATTVRALSQRAGERTAEIFSNRMGAFACAFTGDLNRAHQLTLAGQQTTSTNIGLSYHALLTLEQDDSPNIATPRILFLRGELEEGIALARETLESASQIEHQQPLTLALCMLACPIALWCGDLEIAAVQVERFRRHLDRYSAGPSFKQWARGYELALSRSTSRSTGSLVQEQYFPLLTDNLCSIHEDFVTDAAIARAQSGHAGWCAAEIFRAQGNRRRRVGAADEAEALFRKALELAQRQGARFWELRAAIDLASLLRDRDRNSSAVELLEPAYAPFARGPQVSDVQRAGCLLGELQSRSS